VHAASGLAAVPELPWGVQVMGTTSPALRKFSKGYQSRMRERGCWGRQRACCRLMAEARSASAARSASVRNTYTS
jgi:hypothetical protein